VRRVPPPAVANSRRGKQYRAKLTRLVTKPTHKHTRVVDSLGRRYCQSARARPCSNGYLDRCAKLDGNGVHSQRKAVRTHPLPLHRPLLSRDDRAGRRAWFWPRLRRHLRLAGIGSRHSARKQAPLVGDRACLGQILLRQNVQARLVRCWRRQRRNQAAVPRTERLRRRASRIRLYVHGRPTLAKWLLEPREGAQVTRSGPLQHDSAQSWRRTASLDQKIDGVVNASRKT
jgi:hypothetical protein